MRFPYIRFHYLCGALQNQLRHALSQQLCINRDLNQLVASQRLILQSEREKIRTNDYGLEALGERFEKVIENVNSSIKLRTHRFSRKIRKRQQCKSNCSIFYFYNYRLRGCSNFRSTAASSFPELNRERLVNRLVAM